jgi:hypothetical protein
MDRSLSGQTDSGYPQAGQGKAANWVSRPLFGVPGPCARAGRTCIPDAIEPDQQTLRAMEGVEAFGDGRRIGPEQRRQKGIF